MYSDGAYAPFGEGYAQTGTADLSFTGMNQDTVSNLYDFPAREYGIQGRWPSPDPAGILAVDPTDPQTWNRYAYVRNSPLSLVDPTGLDGEDEGGGGTWCDNFLVMCQPCGIYMCGPINLPPDMPTPVVTSISISSAPSTTGLPSGFLATGPGIDYSWLGLLDCNKLRRTKIRHLRSFLETVRRNPWADRGTTPSLTRCLRLYGDALPFKS